IANCSASLVASDVILTAAHCIDNSPGTRLEDYYAVFNYRQSDPFQTKFKIHKSDVFELKDKVYYRFDKYRGVDIALIALDRKANIRPLKISEEVPRRGTEIFI